MAAWASAQRKETSHLTTNEHQNDLMPMAIASRKRMSCQNLGIFQLKVDTIKNTLEEKKKDTPEGHIESGWN